MTEYRLSVELTWLNQLSIVPVIRTLLTRPKAISSVYARRNDDTVGVSDRAYVLSGPILRRALTALHPSELD